EIAAIRAGVARVRSVLPGDAVAFADDRTVREVVVLNLFEAIQESVSLAAHWLADEGLDVPQTYGDVFRRLGERGVIPADLAEQLAAASGLRNLVAHRYGVLDWSRIHALASERLDDQVAFCDHL